MSNKLTSRYLYLLLPFDSLTRTSDILDVVEFDLNMTSPPPPSYRVIGYFPDLGLLNSRYTRLHRTRDLPSKRLRQRMRLVVTGCDHV